MKIDVLKNLIKKNKEKSICILIVVVSSIIMLCFRGAENMEPYAKLSIIWSVLIFIFEIFYVSRVSKSFFTPSLLFLMAFYVFQNGQLLLYALNIKFDSTYLVLLDAYLLDVAIFSSISNMLAGLAGVLLTKRPNDHELPVNVSQDRYDRHRVSSAALMGIAITGIVAIPLLIIKFSIVLRGGYAAVRLYEEGIHQIINLFEYLFVPFSFLFLIYVKDDHKKKFYYIAILIWMIMTALVGDRTTGVSGIATIVYVIYTNRLPKNSSKKKKVNSIIKIVLVGLAIAVFIQVAFAFREQANVGDVIVGSQNRLIKTFAELGFSSFPLFTMMSIVPKQESFLYGQGYLLSIIGGLIPASIDPTGLIKSIVDQSRIFERWQTVYFSDFKFGFGFSLNAEAYVNFGWFGLLSVFLLCIFVLFMLGKHKNIREQNSFDRYTTIILMYSWFTLPRRDSYYVWNAIMYCIILMRVYLRYVDVDKIRKALKARK